MNCSLTEVGFTHPRAVELVCLLTLGVGQESAAFIVRPHTRSPGQASIQKAKLLDGFQENILKSQVRGGVCCRERDQLMPNSLIGEVTGRCHRD